jgi:hypothetical protein
MSSEEQQKIEGFSRLMYYAPNTNDAGYTDLLNYSGCYISKDKHFIIVPDGMFHHRLLPISPDAGKEFYSRTASKVAPLQDVIDYYNKYFRHQLV